MVEKNLFRETGKEVWHNLRDMVYDPWWAFSRLSGVIVPGLNALLPKTAFKAGKRERLGWIMRGRYGNRAEQPGYQREIDLMNPASGRFPKPTLEKLRLLTAAKRARANMPVLRYQHTARQLAFERR